jgi:hypothetical protein
MSDERKGNGPVLPVMGTLWSAAVRLFRMRGPLIKALLAPLGATFVLGMLLGLMAPSLPNGLTLLIGFVLVFVSGAIFAIPCHRVVLGRMPEESAGWVVFTRGNVIRYAFTLFGLMLITMIIALPIAIPLTFSDYPALAYLAVLPTAYVFARLGLSLPAAAVADPLNLDGAWDVSRGNGWRLAIVVVLAPSLITLPVQLIPEAAMTLWLLGIGLLLQMIAAIYGFAVLSASYLALQADRWRPEELTAVKEPR